MMTKDDYLLRHIPHRVNLLLTFKKRFSGVTEKEMENSGYRDFYRCSKDISIMMVRFFLEELGVVLKMDTNEIISIEDLQNKKKVKQFLDRIKKLELIKLIPNEINNDIKLKNDIIAILKAANRAIAHIDELGVDHQLESYSKTLAILIPVINFVEEKIISSVYPSKESYEKAMSLPCNKMERK